MKRILFIFSLLLTVFLVSSHLFASTSVGSVLSADAQWDQSGSPYIIQSRVLIPPGVTLKIGPGVQVVFQGPATLQIGGELKVNGSAAAPAVINMTDGGLRSALFIDGGEAQLNNMKVLSGVFLAQDASIRMDACEVTKGSGLYLKGNTIAHLKNNKFYGNAAGVVLDGTVEANMQFNTLVQNTYGVYLKDFSKLVFVNNSVHDNDSEVVNNGSKAKLGGNYWGTLSPQTVKDKIKGTVSISPMKDLKDILRAYLRSELPVITQSMSDEAEAEDNQADRAARQALKEFRKKQRQDDIRMMEAQNRKSTMIPASIQSSPAVFAPAATATIAPMFDLSAQPAVSLPPAEPSNSSSGIPGSGALPGASLPAPPAMNGASVSPNSSLPAPPDLMNSMPSPPSLSSTASEPPALGNLAAVAPSTIPNGLGVAPASSEVQPPPTGAPGSPSASLPAPSDLNANTASLPSIASQPPVMNSLPPVSTPTPGLGGGSVSADDLASVVATAQAASTAAMPVESPSPTVMAAPAISLPDSSSNPGSTGMPAVDQSASALQNSLPPAVGDTATFTSTPIVVSTDTFTSTPTSTDTAVDTSTSTSTPTFTFTSMPDTATFTSTPIALISTPTPLPAVPPPPQPVSAAPAVSAAPPPPPVDSSSPSAGSLVPIAPKDSVPPPPDFGDDSSASGVKSPVIIPDANSPAPVAPPPPPQPTTPPADLDVDGMQAPPMDSGLDYANPKK